MQRYTAMLSQFKRLLALPLVMVGLVFAFQNCSRTASFVQDPNAASAASQGINGDGGSGIIPVWTPGAEVRVNEGESVSFVNIPMEAFSQATTLSWEVVGASSRLSVSSGSIPVAGGTTSVPLSLTALSNSTIEGNISYTLVFHSNGVEMPDLERRVTIVDRSGTSSGGGSNSGGSGGSGGSSSTPITYPKVSFSAPTCQAGNLCKVIVSLSKAASAQVKFDWRTNDTAYQSVSGVAQPNVNYVPLQTVVTFPAGSTVQYVYVQSLVGNISLIQIPYIWSNCYYGSGAISCSVFN